MKDRRLERMPLRDLLTQSEHKFRELSDHLSMDLNTITGEIHKQTRPNRDKSPYPTVRSLCNLQDKVRESLNYANEMSETLNNYIEAIEARLPQAGVT